VAPLLVPSSTDIVPPPTSEDTQYMIDLPLKGSGHAVHGILLQVLRPSHQVWEQSQHRGHNPQRIRSIDALSTTVVAVAMTSVTVFLEAMISVTMFVIAAFFRDMSFVAVTSVASRRMKRQLWTRVVMSDLILGKGHPPCNFHFVHMY
jgi:hypothetical protein